MKLTVATFALALAFAPRLSAAQTREAIRPVVRWRTFFRPAAEINAPVESLERALRVCNAAARTAFPATRVELRVRLAATGRVLTAAVVRVPARRPSPWHACALRTVRRWQVTRGEAAEFTLTLDWISERSALDELLPNEREEERRGGVVATPPAP